ncbi:hypothetical protein [Empedobacter sp.]|uniref:hypothetical protein n=1 Tax=Empedobacter sp. TaxID=1927715 RepID=UPI00289F98B1|nr:hypothetical protein [Empedobacter sp.]
MKTVIFKRIEEIKNSDMGQPKKNILLKEYRKLVNDLGIKPYKKQSKVDLKLEHEENIGNWANYNEL